jgi:benzoyl-CoA reductase/2-hydroxyglutaryl-CoA dehydratase subunit BcrC/BadD/HgdB
MDISKLGRGAATERIDKWRADGGKAIGIICCHVPFELLHAAGVFPVRLRATGCRDNSIGGAYIGESCCSFTKSLLQRLADGTYKLDGVVASNSCTVADMVFVNYSSLCAKEGREQFLRDIDAPRMCNEASQKYFGWELEDLKTALEEYTGKPITNEALKASTDTYNEARRLIKKIYDLHKADSPIVTGEDSLRLTLAATEMPVEEYIELLRAFLADCEGKTSDKVWPARVMVAGSAMDDPEFIKAIEDFGCLVVADMNSFGLRFLRDEIPYDENDVLASLGKYYINRSSCPRMVDQTDELHEYVLDAVKEYRVDGVILEKLSNCDKWQSEVPILADVLTAAGIPNVQIERDEQMGSGGQLGIRIEAFREMLENR